MTTVNFRTQKATIEARNGKGSGILLSQINSTTNNGTSNKHRNSNDSNIYKQQKPLRHNSFRSTITTNSSSSQQKSSIKILLPPTSNNMTSSSQQIINNRARTDSTSSRNSSIRSSSRSRPRPIFNKANSFAGEGFTGSAFMSMSGGRSISERSTSSKVSSASMSAATKMLSSSPKFLPWAFRNVSSRFIPSALEIADHDRNVMLNRQRSLSDSMSSLNNDSVEGGSSSFGLSSSSNNHLIGNKNGMNPRVNTLSTPNSVAIANEVSANNTFTANSGGNDDNGRRLSSSFEPRTNYNPSGGLYKDKPLGMDTIHSSQSALFESNNTLMYSSNTFNTLDTPAIDIILDTETTKDLHSKVAPITGSKKTIKKKKKPPLHSYQHHQQQQSHNPRHSHTRSLSADNIDFMPQDPLLANKVMSPQRVYGATSNDMRKLNNAHFIAITATNVTSDASGESNNNMHELNMDMLSPIRVQQSLSSDDDSYERNDDRDLLSDPLIDNRERALNTRKRSESLPTASTAGVYRTNQYDLYDDHYTNHNHADVNVTSIQTSKLNKISVLDQQSAAGAIVPRRSIRRRIFLLLTEPQTSILSAVIFGLYFFMLLASVIVMMIQTMKSFQYTPAGCEFCHNADYVDNNTIAELYDAVYDTGDLGHQPNGIPCVCAPIAIPQLIKLEDWIIYFFSVEWILRVASYEPLISADHEHLSFWEFLLDPYTILDFVATFPYYLIRFRKIEGMVALRLLRFFRVFQLLRLKKYDIYLTTMIRVLMGSIKAIHIYLLTLLFLAAVFGSVIYWFERGEWKYTTELLEQPGYAYIRVSADGITEELSPFHSIPGSFWWFFVTATTAGYGDAYPTSTCGKIVAVFALLCGVLVIAFPVSIFSELWSKELQEMSELRNFYDENDGDDFDDDLSNHDGRAPVKFVSTSSEHNFLGSADDDTLSYATTVHESHVRDSRKSEDPPVKTDLNNEKDKRKYDNSDSESSYPTEFTSKDVADLRRYVESIEDAQQKIRKILSKIEL